MDNFAHNLRLAITESGWNQDQAAKALDISQGLVSRYTTGATRPHRRTLAHLAARLGMPVEVLLNGNASELREHLGIGVQPPLVVREIAQVYEATDHRIRWLKGLKEHWRRKGGPQQELRLALMIVFRDDAEEVFKWLDQP